MESNLGEAALLQALNDLAFQLILEGHKAREQSEESGTPVAMHTVLMSQHDIKLTVAFQLTRLIDDHKKGRLV